MSYQTYTVTLTFDTFQFRADLVEASANIQSVDEDGEVTPSPYQTADARHRECDAAKLLLRYYGGDYWLNPDHEVDDDAGTIDGVSEDEYLDRLIVSVEADTPALSVSIYRRMDDGRWLWAGDGRMDGNAIADCAANLGDDVYGALEDEIDGEVGIYYVTVDGQEYRADVTAE